MQLGNMAGGVDFGFQVTAMNILLARSSL